MSDMYDQSESARSTKMTLTKTRLAINKSLFLKLNREKGDTLAQPKQNNRQSKDDLADAANTKMIETMEAVA